MENKIIFQVSNEILTDPTGAYQTVLKYLSKKNEKCSTEIIYKAFCDILTIKDDYKSEALKYFLDSSLPTKFVNKVPLGVIAAKLPDHHTKYHILVVLRLHSLDLIEEQNEDKESALSILSQSNPSLLEAILNDRCIKHYYD